MKKPKNAMEIKNNKEEVPFEHYLQRFRQMDPEDVLRRLEIPFGGGAPDRSDQRGHGVEQNTKRSAAL